jgi:hypothetical protein
MILLRIKIMGIHVAVVSLNSAAVCACRLFSNIKELIHQK